VHSKKFWQRQSFSREEMSAPGFPKLPFRREDLTDSDAARLNEHFAARFAASERQGREERAESWLTRFLSVWSGKR